MTPNNQQRGSTLLVALIMLVLLTLIALSAIDSTTTSVQMVGNAQFREEAIAAAQQVVEIVASNNDFMLTPPFPKGAGKPVDVNGDNIDDYMVIIDPKPSCLKSEPVSVGTPGVPSDCAASSSLSAVCYWTVWDIRAVVDDPATGASVVLHQGVNVLAGWKAADSCR